MTTTPFVKNFKKILLKVELTIPFIIYFTNYV